MLGVLALLMAGGVIVAIASLAYGKQAARQSYDRLLLGAANDIAESTKIVNGAPIVDLPVSAFSLLSLALDDRISYAVRDASGVLLTGYENSPVSDGTAEQVLFDAKLQNDPARFATVARRFAERNYSGTVYFTVGHTLRARNAMALELTKKALLGMGVAGLILMICAFFVIRSTMRPLQHMATDLLERDHCRRKSVYAAVGPASQRNAQPHFRYGPPAAHSRCSDPGPCRNGGRPRHARATTRRSGQAAQADTVPWQFAGSNAVARDGHPPDRQCAPRGG